MTTLPHVAIPLTLLNEMVAYLSKQPYQEVHLMMRQLDGGVQAVEFHPPQAPASEPAAGGEHGGGTQQE